MNYDLFEFDSCSTSGIHFEMLDADVSLYQSLYSTKEADLIFNELRQEIMWEQEKIEMYGKTHQVPRLTAWYGDDNKTYTYSGITTSSRPWIRCLLNIKQKIEVISQTRFNIVLLNFYRSGADSVAWHSDDEPELGHNPVIGSVSFGQQRVFQMKHKIKKDERQKIMLGHGDFLLMKSCTQHHWVHQVPKSKTYMKERINLTFRTVSELVYECVKSHIRPIDLLTY
jgi:alkylated DNA repair dioxygenase AlkB